MVGGAGRPAHQQNLMKRTNSGRYIRFLNLVRNCSVRAWKTSETIGVGVNWVFTSQDTEVLQVWCGRATLVTKNANSCTNIAILQFGGDSSQENVRAFTWGSVPSPRSYSLHRWLCGSTQGFHTSLHYISQIGPSAGSSGLSTSGANLSRVCQRSRSEGRLQIDCRIFVRACEHISIYIYIYIYISPPSAISVCIQTWPFHRDSAS